MVLLTSDERDNYHHQAPPLHHRNHHHNHRSHRNHNNNMMVATVENGDSRGGGVGGGGGSCSSTLSKFTSLPCFNIRWGRQKQLRCVKGADNDENNELMTRSELKRRRSSSVENDDGGIQAVGEKLLLDFRRETAQMQAAFLKKSDVGSTVPPPSPEADQRPWNLRTRRAVCKGPSNNNYNNNNNNVLVSSERRPSASPVKVADAKSPDFNSGPGGGGGNGGYEGPRAKFTRGLSKQEIEEDFLAIIGTRPVRRPKKRPKIVQRQIDAMTPGNWLTEITADMYKVNEQV